MTKEEFVKAWYANEKGFRYEWRRRGVYVVGQNVIFTKGDKEVVTF